MKRIIVFCILCMFFLCTLEAGYFIKMKIEDKTDPRGKLVLHEEQPTIIEIWVGDNYMLTNFSFFDTTAFYFYLNLSEKKQYIVNFSEKAYYEFPSVHEELDKELTDERFRNLEESLDKLTQKIEVKRLEKKREIGEWLCTGYRIEYKRDETITNINEIWVTKDVPFDWRLFEQIEERFSSEKMIRAADYLNNKYNYPDIEGFEIEKISKIIKNGEERVCSITRVVEISEKEPPAALLTFPKGFKKVEE